MFAHRCVLACRCQAFRGMLSQGLTGSKDATSNILPQGPFILGNVQPEVFLAVIEFLYTNSINLNSQIVSGDRIVGVGGTRQGCGCRGCFAAPGVPKVEGILCKTLSGWLTVQRVCGVSAQHSLERLVPHICPSLGTAGCAQHGCCEQGQQSRTPSYTLMRQPLPSPRNAPRGSSHRGRTTLALGPQAAMLVHDAHKVSLACRCWRC